MTSILLLSSIIFPIVFGVLIFFLHFKKRLAREIYVETVTIATSLLVLAWILLHSSGDSIILFSFAEGLNIGFSIDGLTCVFAGLIAFLWPLAALYAFEYMEDEGGEDRFFAFYTVTYGITIGVAASENLITMYLFYELLTLITLPLVMHDMTKRAVRAGRKYLTYSISGAAMAFIGIVILYRYGGAGLSFRYGGLSVISNVYDETETLMLQIGFLLMFFGFGVKAAVFPLCGWLPTAGVAPTPVTALLHAVAVVNAGVFAIIRTIYDGFGTEFLSGTWVQTVAMAFALITILYGSSMALKEQHFKRRLAYSTISNLSYIVFGATMMSTAGLTAALSHMVFHGLMKITLFFCAGTVLVKTDREYVTELDGLGRKMPVTFAAFTIGSLALVGIPLLPGFLSKWNLAQAAILGGSTLEFVGVGVLILSSVLTAGYLFSVVIRAYFPGKNFDVGSVAEIHDPGWRMKLPMILLCTAMLILGVCSGWLFTLLENVAAGA